VARVELVVTDLDGTLWDRNDELHPLTLDAIAELERRGIHLLVATGRRVTSTRVPLARAGLAPAAVVLNGAMALELATATCFHRHPFPRAEAASVLQAFRAFALEPCVYVEHPDLDVFVGASPSTHPDHIRALGARVKEVDLEEVIECHPVLGFGIMGRPAELLTPAASAAARLGEAHLGPALVFEGASLTVAPLGLSKWDGVVAYCERHNLDPAAVLAVGDGPNDLELLGNASIAVVPSDAHPYAMARADHYVGPPHLGGWAQVLSFL
jgi:hydroxymethylpyrimidine pyrophosphatase-like HAD family hydrolase